MQLRSSIPDLYTERLAFLEDVLFDEYDLEDGVVSRLFKMRDLDKAFVNTTTVASFGTVPIKAEGADVTYDELAMGYDQKYQADTYALAFRTSKEALDDEQEEIISDAARALGNSMSYAYNVDHANVFNRGFNSSYTFADGKELFATDHPLIGGGTEQNELTTSADLSVSSYRDALNDIADTVDDAGKLIHWRPASILVPYENQWLASELIDSPGAPDTANRAINAFRTRPDGKVSIIAWPYLTDNDAFFLLATPEKHQIRSYWRERPNVMHDWDFESASMKVLIRARWKRGASDWRGVYGSPGA